MMSHPAGLCYNIKGTIMHKHGCVRVILLITVLILITVPTIITRVSFHLIVILRDSKVLSALCGGVID